MLILRNIFLLAGVCVLLAACQGEGVQDRVDSTEQRPSTYDASSPTDVKTPPISSRRIITDQDLELCMDIANGQVLASALVVKGKARYNFYLECVLNPFTDIEDFSPLDRDKARIVQNENSAYLLAQNIDSDYVTTNGYRLLHMVIGSELSQEQKMIWLEHLVNAGADVNYMNESGNEALGAAGASKSAEIYDWLVDRAIISI